MLEGAAQRRPPGVVLVEPGGSGGVGDYTAQLAAALAEAGHRVDVVTGNEHRLPSAPGVEVHPLVVWERGRNAPGRLLSRLGLRPAINALRFIAVIPQIVALGSRRGVLHVQGTYYLPLYALLAIAARAASVPVVFTPHNTFVRSGRQLRSAWALVYRLSSAIVIHVQSELELLSPAETRKAAVIPIGNYRAVAASGSGMEKGKARQSLGLDGPPLVVLLFGQLRPDKGIGDLLVVAAEQVPEIAVILAGEEAGGLSAAEELLEAPSLEGRVVIREGFLPMDEVARVFAAADVAVYPYSRVSQSAAALLAYGFDTPVVVYPVGGLPELVEEGETGWVTRRPDGPALAETLREVVALGPEECARRGEAGGRFADSQFSWSMVAERTAEVYRRVVGAEGSPSVVLLQTIVPDYREAFVRCLKERLGASLVVLAGSRYFDPSVVTSPSVGSQVRRIDNRFLGGRRLLWQAGAVRTALSADVVLVEFNPRIVSSWVILALRRVMGRRTIVWGHAYPFSGPQSRTETVRAVMRRLASATIVYTEKEAAELRAQRPQARVIAAPNALYPAEEMVSTPSRGGRAFLCVGRMIPEKKPQLVLDAFLSAQARLPADCRLVFVGDGPLRQGLEARVRALGAEKRVSFLGHVSNSERLRELYADAIASVSPGYVGLSLIQSLGFGVPMLTARNEPHSPEIEAAREGWNAVTFESDDTEGLAAALVDFARDRSEWAARRAEISRACAEDYSLEAMVDRVMSAVADA